MKYQNIGDSKTINAFVNSRVNDFKKMDKTFSSIYAMMFKNGNNIIFEESIGYKIKKTTYNETKEAIDIMALNLKNKTNLEYNSVIGIYLENSPIWIESFWAILKAGYRPILLNMRLSLDELNKTLNKMNCQFVISEEDIFNVKCLKPSELLARIIGPYPNEFGEELFVMSSGSSLNVKICAYSANEFYYLISDSIRIIKDCKIVKKHTDGELKLLTFLPFYHIFGLVAVYILFAFFARTFVKLNDLLPQTIVNTIRRHKVTHIFAVPLFFEKTYETAIKEIKNMPEGTYAKLMKGIKISNKLGNSLIGRLFTKIAFKEVREKMFGNSINFMITGGSMIKKEVLEFFNAVGYHLANGYGMSEIGITSVELSMKRKYLIDSSIGNPLGDIKYHISEQGELLVKGDSLAKYIIEGDEIHYKDGNWFNTHDLARYEHGRYYIEGRMDDLVIPPSGENINPHLIEPKLMMDGINSLCLINSKNGPVLLISVKSSIPSGELDILKDKYKTRLSELNLTTQITKIEFISDSLIGDNDFKVNRKKLENKYNNNELHQINPNIKKVRQDDLTDKIRRYFAEALNKKFDEIYPTSDFFVDEGGDSLEYLGLLTVLSKDFNVEFPSNYEGLTTPYDIANYMRDKI